ncbi:MAG TPA: DUF3618 domain-containing protein [Acidimicrobiia bacterium]|nr:DUF3618 domain-containing protein [Acidimicrobiia bacterium]
MTRERGDDVNDEATAARVADLKAEIDTTRHEIDLTLLEIEDRLSPERIADRVGDRVREATAGWRERPMDEMRSVVNDGLTRLREMAWMNPVGLGLSAAVVGFILGRKVGG